MRHAILFDDGKGILGPLADLRPSYAIRTGALRTRDRLVRALGVQPVAVWPTPTFEPLARTVANELPINQVPAPSTGDPVLLLNGRCVIPPADISTLWPGEILTDKASGDLVAALVAATDVPKLIHDSRREHFTGDSLRPTARAIDAALLTRPWSVRQYRDEAMAIDLDLLTRSVEPTHATPGCTLIGPHPLRVHPSARVYPGCIFDLESGPIVVEADAVLRPGCTIIGPAYIGTGSTVLDRAIIKATTAIGPQCKVAGEIGGTIFQGYANKSHDGHLGDSWIGKWANLGAGTTNSNLLNTYAEVLARATPDAPTERTGQQFLGAIIGDHVKTAICTRLMTGVVICTGAMLAQTAAVSGCVPRFAWCTDDAQPPGSRSFRMDKFLDIARTVMKRRNRELVPAYEARIRDLAAGLSPALAL